MRRILTLFNILILAGCSLLRRSGRGRGVFAQPPVSLANPRPAGCSLTARALLQVGGGTSVPSSAYWHLPDENRAPTSITSLALPTPEHCCHHKGASSHDSPLVAELGHSSAPHWALLTWGCVKPPAFHSLINFSCCWANVDTTLAVTLLILPRPGECRNSLFLQAWWKGQLSVHWRWNPHLPYQAERRKIHSLVSVLKPGSRVFFPSF